MQLSHAVSETCSVESLTYSPLISPWMLDANTRHVAAHRPLVFLLCFFWRKSRF
eukprot:COSAG01_NODE_51947_length_350_cov_1.430279_2_plen_53_part_01